MNNTNNIPVVIKAANLMSSADLETIARMELAINLELRPRFKFNLSDKTVFNRFVEAIRKSDSNTKMIRAYAGNNIAGYLKSFMNNYRNTMEHRLLFVYPQFRKLGVGSKLLKRGEEEAIEKGYDLIEAYASASVQPFYKKNGFVPVAFNDWDERMIKKLR